MDPLVLYGALFFISLLAVGAFIWVYLSRTEGTPPVDPQAMIDGIDEPVVVIAADETVVMANLAFRSVVARQPVGQSLDSVLADAPVSDGVASVESESTITLETPDGPRHIDICSFPLGAERDPNRKRFVLFHDVTDRERRERTLTAQNERLDAFASLISHDLRNPLDVAIGRTNAARAATADPDIHEHLDHASDAHERMCHIITDVLMLARGPDKIDDQTAVSIADVATTAWEYVDTANASLSVETEAVVTGAETHLLRLFENLFRNAVEHGGESVTVRVGDHPDGFYVADDGVGIPPDEREHVFETGYTGRDGTGLGLAIVDRIAEAHGWDCRVTGDETGGAKFILSGVETATNPHAAETVTSE